MITNNILPYVLKLKVIYNDKKFNFKLQNSNIINGLGLYSL